MLLNYSINNKEIHMLILGGFNLHEQNGAQDMVEKILTMLSQFLISNQPLQLNETFKVYLKILSIDHMKVKEREKARTQKKRTKAFYQKHTKKTKYGIKTNEKQKLKYFWAEDIPNSFHGEPYFNFFKNKCLLVCTILGLLQNNFFENKKNNKFKFILKSINSINLKKQNKAGNILVNEFNQIIEITKLSNEGPYELESTCKILSETLGCQFIIFNGISSSSKLLYMYPENYSDNLKPIYLYQPNSMQNHLVFIKHLASFQRNNFRVCLSCKKTFYARTSQSPLHYVLTDQLVFHVEDFL
jgi:hypothetical protein